MGEGEGINQLLSSFSCKLDKDVEYFLHQRALEFERLSKARTYIVFDEEMLVTKPIFEQQIIGYVALAQKVLSIPDDISNRKRKQLDGYIAKIHGELISEFPCYRTIG